MTEKQNRSLQATVHFIRKNFPAGICEVSAMQPLSVLPTDLPELDEALPPLRRRP